MTVYVFDLAKAEANEPCCTRDSRRIVTIERVGLHLRVTDEYGHDWLSEYNGAALGGSNNNQLFMECRTVYVVMFADQHGHALWFDTLDEANKAVGWSALICPPRAVRLA